MKMIFLLLFIIFCSSSLFAQNYSKKGLKYKPKTLVEAVEQLKKLHSDSVKTWIISQEENDFTLGAHRGLGMWMRNKWGLWGREHLVKHFSEMGVFHPDDMSGIILRTYYRDLKGLEWELEGQIKRCQEAMKEMEEHLYKMEHEPVMW